MMPYKKIEDLPAPVKKLPLKAQQMFMSAFNKVIDKYDEDTAFQIAWGVIKKKFKKVEGKWIAKGMSADTFTFDIELKDDVFIQKAEDGNYYIEGVLSDIFPDSDGWSFTEDALKDFAEQINNLPIFGGITHQEWNDIKMKYSHLPENLFVEKARNERQGILKTVKAIYDKGKLLIKAIVDKRYLNHVNKFNKMSLEAFMPIKDKVNKKYIKGKILGFALDNNAINPRSTVKLK